MRLVLHEFLYPGDAAPALRDIDLHVLPGTCTLVAGGSGAGKSTLAKVLAGVLPGRHGGDLTGHFELGGERLEFTAAQPAVPASTGSPARPAVVGTRPRINPAAWNREIAYVGQEPSAQLSTVAATVAEELAFALENAGTPRPEMLRRVQETASAFGLTDLLERRPTELSGGELRRVTIAGAAVLEPKVLVLDEPTAGLDATARGQVEGQLQHLLGKGIGLVLLAPGLGGVGTLADRVVLLEQGRCVWAGPRGHAAAASEALEVPILPDPAAAAPEPALRRITPGVPKVATAVSLDRVQFSYGTRLKSLRLRPRSRQTQTVEPPKVLDGVSLAVGPGETVVIAGANGAGKSSLLRHLNGLARPDSGAVSIRGSDIGPLTTGEVAAEVGFLFQNPLDQLFERTVRREVAYGVRAAGRAAHSSRTADIGTSGTGTSGTGAFWTGPRPAAANDAVQEALERCGLREVAEAHPHELPVSQQRLVALATVLARRPAVLALDEPTVALDRPGVDRLAGAIRDEANRGAAVVLVTHDLDFAYATCGRLVLLSAGRILADGPMAEVLEEHFRNGRFVGVEAPEAWLRWRAERRSGPD
ncbi:MAG: transporter [Micrococcaceae bacterium]|nr:transporter [Micrococcaceae bacterium]